MADSDLIEAFDNCIERLADGQSIDDCLRAYPQHAARLRPMLEAGTLVNRAQPSGAEIATAQERVRFQIAQVVINTPHRRNYPLARLATIAAGLAIIILFTVGAAGALAQFALPGDILYGFKRLTESIVTLVTRNPEPFEQRRIEETMRLLALTRIQNVTFWGEVEIINGSAWQVASLPVTVQAGTPGAEGITIGDWLEVEGFTTPQAVVFATRITIVERAQPEIMPIQTSTLVPTITSTPTLTSTTTPEITLTATPTQTASPTPSVTACATTQPSGWMIYQIRAGDTLTALAARAGVTIEEILRVNCLTDPSHIIIEQQIYLPPMPTTMAPTQPPTPGGNGDTNENHSPDDSSENGNSNENENEDSNSGSGSGGENGNKNDND